MSSRLAVSIWYGTYSIGDKAYVILHDTYVRTTHHGSDKNILSDQRCPLRIRYSGRAVAAIHRLEDRIAETLSCITIYNLKSSHETVKRRMDMNKHAPVFDWIVVLLSEELRGPAPQGLRCGLCTKHEGSFARWTVRQGSGCRVLTLTARSINLLASTSITSHSVDN